jgi:glycosyltransferase involved in cell wall biosynthesis
MNQDKTIVMLSTSGTGGIVSVVEGYQRDGLFERWGIHLVVTNVDGSLFCRLNKNILAFTNVIVLAAKRRIALLHCHVACKGSFWRKSLFAALGRFFGIPVIMHLHAGETENFYNSLSVFAKRIVTQQFTAANVVIVLSESWQKFVLKVAPKAHVVVIPNYVEMPKSIKMTKKTNQIVVLFLGTVNGRKGVYDLLSAFSDAVKHIPQLFLSIGGDGDIESARNFAHELGIEAHVEFLGWVSGDEKNELFQAADIFVLPSYIEGLPVSVLEAMSWGIPVITTTVGGIPELIDNYVNGFLISPGDICTIQSLLERLALDPAIRLQIGTAGKDIVKKRFSKEVVLPKLELLYAEHIKNS